MTHTDGELRLLLDELVRARAKHREELRGRVEGPQVMATREESLVALEGYVAALEARGLPVPPSMHRELTLYRSLCAHARFRRRYPEG